MRILSFTQTWPKLRNPECSTIRPESHWKAGMTIQVYFQNRTPHRRFIGIATITAVEPVTVEHIISDQPRLVTDEEARDDGFADRAGLSDWMHKMYHNRFNPRMDKLTLRWRIQCLPTIQNE